MMDKHEAMAYADKSLTKTVGANGLTSGSITAGVDMDADYGFGNEHSAEFNRSLAQVETYYYDLMVRLRITENYLDATHPVFTP